jgi:flagellar motility protein MotE (MotC chaperone)
MCKKLSFIILVLLILTATTNIPFQETAAYGKANRDNPQNRGRDCCHPEIIEVLRARARELEQRKLELDKREKDLELLKNDIEGKLEELRKLQKELEGPVSEAIEEKKTKFKHIVKVYSSMDAARAAMLLDRMKKKEVAAILAAMKSKKAAAILANMDPAKAAEISAMISE